MDGFSIQTITALVEVVTGGPGPAIERSPIGIYRTASQLEMFLGAVGLDLHVGGTSRVPTVRDVLTKSNKTPEGREAIMRLIEQVSNPHEYLQCPEKLTAVVDYLNARLKGDGYELQQVVEIYKLFPFSSQEPVSSVPEKINEIQIPSKAPQIPNLKVTKSEAEEKIRQQIKKGKAIANIPTYGIESLIFDNNDLEHERTKFLNWIDFNTTLLKLIFVEDSIADKYYKVSYPEPFMDSRIVTKAKREFISDVENSITELEGILKKLELVPESPEVFTHKHLAKKRIPKFPDIIPSSIKESKFRFVEMGDITTKEDLKELIELLYQEPECKFYYFLEKGAQMDPLLRSTEDRGDLLMQETEFFHYKHPKIKHDYVHIEKRNGNYEWEWEKEVVEKGPMYMRIRLKLSTQKIRELEVEGLRHAIVEQQKSSSSESNRILGDTWSLAGITINCKNLFSRMRRLSGLRKFVAYSLLLLLVTLAVGYYTRLFWTPFIKRVASDSPTRTQPDVPIISKEDNFIDISKLELLGIQNGEFPYEDKILYSFVLTGSFRISEVSEKYSLVVFYKVLSYPDQRYGWFLVHKLDKKGFGIPNSISLDELNPSSWNFYTSRLYLPKDETPIIQFIAFALPTKTLIELERVLVDDELGWGKQSLDFLKNRPDIFHSKITAFSD